MNKHIPTGEPAKKPPRTGSLQDGLGRAGGPPRGPIRQGRRWLILLAAVAVLYVFFGQFILPYQVRWSTISGAVMGGTSQAATEVAAPIQIAVAASTAAATATAQIPPQLQLSEGQAAIDIRRQAAMNELDRQLAYDKARIAAEQAAAAKDATMYQECMAQAYTTAQQAGVLAAASEKGLGISQSQIQAAMEASLHNGKELCDELKEQRDRARSEAVQVVPSSPVRLEKGQ